MFQTATTYCERYVYPHMLTCVGCGHQDTVRFPWVLQDYVLSYCLSTSIIKVTTVNFQHSYKILSKHFCKLHVLPHLLICIFCCYQGNILQQIISWEFILELCLTIPFIVTVSTLPHITVSTLPHVTVSTLPHVTVSTLPHVTVSA